MSPDQQTATLLDAFGMFKGADTVAKVENRTEPKIPRKLIF